MSSSTSFSSSSSWIYLVFCTHSCSTSISEAFLISFSSLTVIYLLAMAYSLFSFNTAFLMLSTYFYTINTSA